jgi:hypothetical protein
MRLEYWWNNADRNKPKHTEVKLSQCHVFYNKSHMDVADFEPWSRRPPVKSIMRKPNKIHTTALRFQSTHITTNSSSSSSS